MIFHFFSELFVYLKIILFIPSKMSFFQYSLTHTKTLAGEKIKYFGLLKPNYFKKQSCSSSFLLTLPTGLEYSAG